MQPVSRGASKTTDKSGRDRGQIRLRSPRALAATLVLFFLLSVMVVESRPAAANSGTLEAAYTGLSWPTALAFAEDGRIFVAERYSGQILIIENGTILPDPFYTFANLATYHDQGLLGLALDPSFPSAPWVYAYYSYDDVANGTTSNRIVRIQATGNSGGSMEVLLDGIPSGVWHIGGRSNSVRTVSCTPSSATATCGRMLRTSRTSRGRCSGSTRTAACRVTIRSSAMRVRIRTSTPTAIGTISAS